MKTLLALLLLLPSLVLANSIDQQCPQFVVRGAPVSPLADNAAQFICKQNYAIHYRFDTKTAEYVVEHVTKESVIGPAQREDDFRPDPAIAKSNQSVLSDYVGHPYDRGHLAPAGDNKQSKEIMSESFFLSNMVPQTPNNNRGIWKQLETAVRNLVTEGKDLYVVSGTHYQPGYLTIGNNVGVPTHLWKVVVDRGSQTGIAFIFPNKGLPVKDLPKYATSIAEVEKLTGINFMPELTPEQQLQVEHEFHVIDWLGLTI